MNRLKELRNNAVHNGHKMRQSDLAELLGVTKLTISNWENGKHEIKADKANEIAKMFNVSVSYLLGYSEYKSLLDITKDFLNKDSDSDNDPEYIELEKQIREEIKEREEHLESERLRRVNNYGLPFYGKLFKFRTDELYELLLDLNVFFLNKTEKRTLTKQDIELGKKLVGILDSEKADIHDMMLSTSEIIKRVIHNPNAPENQHTPTNND